MFPRLCALKYWSRVTCGVQRYRFPGSDTGGLGLVGPRQGFSLRDFKTSLVSDAAGAGTGIWDLLEPGALPFPPSSCQAEALKQRVESSVLDLREISKKVRRAKNLPLDPPCLANCSPNRFVS